MGWSADLPYDRRSCRYQHLPGKRGTETMNQKQQLQPTPLDGIRYFTPPDDYLLRGRDGLVAILWEGKPPIPLLEEDFISAEASGAPDYDMVGRGIYLALRLNPDCVGAAGYP